MRLKSFVLAVFISSMAFLSGPASADVWSPTVAIKSIKPLAAWGGAGIVRVKVSTQLSVVGCVASDEIDLSFSVGTAESRSAVLAALYLAFASQQSVKFFLSDTSCSIGSFPLFTGVEVLN